MYVGETAAPRYGQNCLWLNCLHILAEMSDFQIGWSSLAELPGRGMDSVETAYNTIRFHLRIKFELNLIERKMLDFYRFKSVLQLSFC